MADDDLLAPLDVGQGHRPGAARGRIHRDAAIHLGPLDLHPLAGQAHRGFQIGRRVETFGENAVGGRRRQVDLFDVLGQGADALRAIQQELQQVAGRGRDLDARIGRLVLAAADADVLDLELAAAIHHFVHDSRQGVRIDDVPVELHDLRERHLPVV